MAASASSGDGSSAARAVLSDFNEDLALCEKLVPIIGDLYRRNIIVSVCKTSLASAGPLEVMRAHEFATTHFDEQISPRHTFQIVSALAKIPGLKPWRVDAGFCTPLFAADLRKGEEALIARLTAELDRAESDVERGEGLGRATDVVLYGHGRIGRLLNRLLVEKAGAGGKLNLRAIVVRQKGKSVREDLEKRAALLAKDSVHGPFSGTVAIDADARCIVANGIVIQVIYANQPEDVDYTAYGIRDAIIIDNTGAFRTRAALERHVKCPGARLAVLTAPASGGGVPTIVAGVNWDRIEEGETVYSAASCTTNAIVPVLKVIQDACGVASGHIETVHAFTNDQNLVDNYHKKERRGRAAPLNIVPTETGAAKAVALALPSLAGKLTAAALRVPTPCVSLALLVLRPERPVDRSGLYRALKAASIAGPFHNQIDFSEDTDAVSTDFVGNRAAAVVDWPATIVSEDRIVAKVWYENEAGYSAQTLRLVQRLAGVVFPEFPDVVPEAMLTPLMRPVSHTAVTSPPPLDAGTSAVAAAAAAASSATTAAAESSSSSSA